MKGNTKHSGVSKKGVLKKKIRSVPSLIAKNKKALQKLKPKESSSEESDVTSSDPEVEDDIEAKNNRSLKNTSGKHKNCF